MKKITLALLALMAVVTHAEAGSFQIFPMRLVLTEGAKIGSVTVVNNGDAAVNMQLRGKRWIQGEKGRDIMQDSVDDLIFFPKMFSIPAKGKKMIRVGYRGKAPAQELTYRLYIRELPVIEPGVTGMKFALQLSMPIFVHPRGVGQPPLQTVHGISIYNGKLAANIANILGCQHLQLSKLSVQGYKDGKEVYQADARGWYILAGVEKFFDFNISPEDCRKMDSLKVYTESKAGKAEASFPVDLAMCAQIAVASEAKSAEDGIADQ